MARRLASGLSVLFLAAIAGCNSQAPPPEGSIASAPSDDHAPAASAKPKVYDVDADGFAQIADALIAAKETDKRVLLQFGAEWCGWCHKLHHLFKEDATIADALAASYLVVLIDVDGDHNAAVNEKYGNPMQHGLPVIVVLDSDGTPLTTKNTAELEEGDHHDPALVLAFLQQWAGDDTQPGEAEASLSAQPSQSVAAKN